MRNLRLGLAQFATAQTRHLSITRLPSCYIYLCCNITKKIKIRFRTFTRSKGGLWIYCKQTLISEYIVLRNRTNLLCFV